MDREPLPLLLYGTILAFSVVGSVFATVMFVAQMAFFARVADPAIGGTYMTRAPQTPFFWHFDSRPSWRFPQPRRPRLAVAVLASLADLVDVT